jgi:hypothetical protein
MERMACNSSRWKAADQSEDLRIRRRRRYVVGTYILGMVLLFSLIIFIYRVFSY